MNYIDIKKIFPKTYCILFFVFLCFLPIGVQAEDGYSAQEISRSFGTLYMKPGQAITFELKYKNTGTKNWYRKGNHFVELVTNDPIKRKSVFEHKFWEKDFLVARIKEDVVKPGEIGMFRFALLAPDTEGVFQEKFKGVAKNLAWIDGMDVTIPIHVTVSDIKPKVENKNESQENTKPKDYQMTTKLYSAGLLFGLKDSIFLLPNEKKSLILGFKNTGTRTWKNHGSTFTSFYTIEPKYHKGIFYEPSSWYSEDQVKLTTEKVKPGEIGFFNFNIKAPDKIGRYYEKYHLAIEDRAWIYDGKFQIKIDVINNNSLPIAAEQKLSNDSENFQVYSQANIQIEEPIFKVGLYHSYDSYKIGSSFDYTIEDNEGRAIYDMKSGETSLVSYDIHKKMYQLMIRNQTIYYDSPLKFVSLKSDGFFEVLNREDRPKWNKHINYNKYKGALIVQYSELKDRLWLINEIGMEDYLRGLVETSNSSPYEYLKAMSVAARSYALHHINTQTKYSSDFFQLHSVFDQVYKGYAVETYMPRLSAAIDETKGIIVTYNNEVALTPYFTQSDGHTRSWKQVWGGNKRPWCVSVKDPHNEGRVLLGHGVGISARGALLFAKKDGKTFDQILKHYYTGVDLQKFY